MKVLSSSVLALAFGAMVFAMFTLRKLAAETQHAAGEYRISGPFTHDNLSVFLIHGVARHVKPLLSLEEAIAQRKVIVYETRNVNELTIENVSNEDVFIESGDIVKRGRAGPHAERRHYPSDQVRSSEHQRVLR